MEAFISHAGADKPTARRIATALEDAGIDAWLDEAKIRVGQSIPGEIARALHDSAALVLLISRSAASSSWVERELHAFVMQALEEGKLILPCVLDDARPPYLIADIKYANVRNAFEDGMAALLQGLGIAVILDHSPTAEEVQELAALVGNQLTQEERKKCSPTFTRDGLRLNIFAMPVGRTREIIRILSSTSLIYDSDTRSKGDGPDGTLRSTPLGRAVFAIWDA